MIDDPCGGEPGKARYSYAWMSAELIQRGHPKAWVCHEFASPSEMRAYHEGLGPDAAEHFSRFMSDKERLASTVWRGLKAEAKRQGKSDELDKVLGPRPAAD